MRKLGRIFFTAIWLCLLIGIADCFLPKAHAASAMTASGPCITFIKEVEGFSLKPYYDYGQHTVGYGTKCPTDKYLEYYNNGIPKNEAEALLMEAVAEVCDAINKKLIDPYNLTFNQHEFDALVSFSFNLGTSWMTYDSSLRNALLSNASNDELVYAFSLYCTAGGNYSSGLITRRLCEANMFLNGIYSKTAGNDYGYVFYDPNGGSLTYRVQGFVCENAPSPIADPVRSGDEFLGWYTDLTGGSLVKELTGALTGKTLFARWESSENPENQDSPPALIRVTGDVVNIRKGPGTNYGIARQVYMDDLLIVSHVTELSNRAWGKVQDGWICLEYTNYDAVINGSGYSDTEIGESPSDTDTVPDDRPSREDTNIDMSPGILVPVRGIVRVDDLLRIRSGPGTGYTRVGYLTDGSEVEILEQTAVGSTRWGRIVRGWVCMDYIITEDSSQDLPPESDKEQDPQPDREETESDEIKEAAAIKGIIIADALRIRSGPGTEYPITGFYYQNEPVAVSEKVLVDSVYWGKTTTGWINMDYVQTENAPPSAANNVKTVIADCLRVRKETRTDSRIAALLYYGDKVTVLETVTVDGTVWGRLDKGWICMDYVV